MKGLAHIECRLTLGLPVMLYMCNRGISRYPCNEVEDLDFNLVQTCIFTSKLTSIAIFY